MDGSFYVKLALSFAAGSLWITAGTVLAEKYGTKIGGLVAGLPSTILLSMFFIAWTQSPGVAVAATTIVPLIGGINCLFIVTYIVLLRINFWLAVTGSVVVWFGLSLIAVLVKTDNFGLSLVFYAAALAASHHFLEKRWHVPSEPGKHMRYTAHAILCRGLFSGFIISAAVLLAKVSGPLLGGAFAMFPAMFIGTLFITYFSHGPSFSAAVMKASVMGAISVVIYGVSIRFTYVPCGLWLGTVISVCVSYGCSFFIHRFVLRQAA
jgi:hypothetical protein